MFLTPVSELSHRRPALSPEKGGCTYTSFSLKLGFPVGEGVHSRFLPQPDVGFFPGASAPKGPCLDNSSEPLWPGVLPPLGGTTREARRDLGWSCAPIAWGCAGLITAGLRPSGGPWEHVPTWHDPIGTPAWV